MSPNTRHFRIHGDNIVECERTLALLSKALETTFHQTSKGTLFRPIHQATINGDVFLIELLSGHGRWGVDIGAVLLAHGGILREGADSYMTEVKNGVETLLFALEYCSALPAGNNAWQRNGRAYSSVLAGIPYFYFAEIGGVELDAGRKVKAPRFPNPVVPYSYIAATSRMNQFCIPVYAPHPSISADLYARYNHVFGMDDSLHIMRGIIFNEDFSQALNALRHKGIEMVKTLSGARRQADTFRGGEWTAFYNSPSKMQYINNSGLIWNDTLGSKVVVSETYRKLRERVLALECKTIGAKSLPICVVPQRKIQSLRSILNDLYSSTNISIADNKDLVIVWITGFKPKGDDSRPDRGLTPLAKMTTGGEADILVVVSGPAKPDTWERLQASRTSLAAENGLWQSILNIARYVLVDSVTCPSKLFYQLNGVVQENREPVTFGYSNANPDFGEHDTDTAVHTIFSRKESLGMKEALCNPPGGDWSGISYFTPCAQELRWTSLPRVSTHAKRPDHLIQVQGRREDTLIVIESKQHAKDLEDHVGDGLKAYITSILNTPPTAIQTPGSGWRMYEEQPLTSRPYKMITVGAFLYDKKVELSTHLVRGKLDAVFAFEFDAVTRVHVLAPPASSIVDILKKAAAQTPHIEVEIHGF